MCHKFIEQHKLRNIRIRADVQPGDDGCGLLLLLSQSITAKGSSGFVIYEVQMS